MPTELRKVAFSNSEVVSAVYDHLLRNGAWVASSPVKSLEVVKSPEIMVVVGFDNDRTIEVTASDVAAALIRHCKQVGVPLPRKAAKILNIEGDGLVLLINKNYVSPLAKSLETALARSFSESAETS